jgi:hypothetical protein
MHIAAVVVSLPDRGALLTEALDSVRRQTRAVDDCVVGIDPYKLGEVHNMNRLIEAAVSGARIAGAVSDEVALAFLHDDDVWLPNHIGEAAKALQAGADVVVSRCKTTGRRPALERRCVQEVTARGGNPASDFSDIMRDNWFVPSMVVARASVFGWWVDAEPAPAGSLPGSGAWVDWTNWRRLHTEGARFYDTGRTTVMYRFGPWNEGRSWSPT